MICDFAIQHLGPPQKKNQGARSGRGVVMHSAEGSLEGTLKVLDSVSSQVSWHFTVALDGTLYQHYDTTIQAWHAHSVGNINYVGVEHENAYTDGHPNHDSFSAAQVATDIRLLKWLHDNEGWDGYDRRIFLWEHNEVPGNNTVCPSARVPWLVIMAGLVMPSPTPTPPAQPTEMQALRALVRAGSIIAAGDQDLRTLGAEDKSALAWVSATANG